MQNRKCIQLEQRLFVFERLLKSRANFRILLTTEPNTDVIVTGKLWYMMVAAYILPTLGIGTFFIGNIYWMQQFLIGLGIDFVKLLQIFEDTNHVLWQDEKFSETIAKFFRNNGRGGTNSLSAEYKEMRKISFCEKVGYSSKSPGLVIACMLYAACHLAFILLGVYAFDNMARVVVAYLNGGGRSTYVFVTTAFCVIINIYPFFVAAFWTMIIVVLVAFAIVILIICCICLFCG